MHGQGSHQHESGSLDKFLFPLAPFGRFPIGKTGLVEEVAAALVTDIPGVELSRPFLHLRGCNFRGTVNHACEDSRLMDAGFPEPDGKRVAHPGLSRDLSKLRDGDTA